MHANLRDLTNSPSTSTTWENFYMLWNQDIGSPYVAVWVYSFRDRTRTKWSLCINTIFQIFCSSLSFVLTFFSFLHLFLAIRSFLLPFLLLQASSSFSQKTSWLHGSRIFCTSNGREHKIWVDTNRLLHRWLGRCSSLSSGAHRLNAFFY